jgi:cellulose synthase/poly-beta-1,6-N-acetylglucosamine synthase-like glycosyltransferase
VVVPAHDEEAGIARTVSSLFATDYPEELRRVVVVADNCTDATAERAEAAGATVLVRRDESLRGKGYALAHGFAALEREGWAEAVVVVDADTVVSPNLLRAFSARLDAGAEAVQADYGVQNPDASWRTRLMALAFFIQHRVRSLGRERLGASCGLRGNGMCFRWRVLREVPQPSFSVVEDIEYGVRLGDAGVRVHYAPEAQVWGEMPSTAHGSGLQRHRWERGRRTLVRTYAARLLRRGLAERDPVRLDLFLDVTVPPLTQLAAAAAAGTAAAAICSWWTGTSLVALWLFACSDLLLAFHVIRGAYLSPQGLRGLGLAPAYVFWKLGLMLKRPGPRGAVWVRTPREGKS